jgi:hypothetical protein
MNNVTNTILASSQYDNSQKKGMTSFCNVHFGNIFTQTLFMKNNET